MRKFVLLVVALMGFSVAFAQSDVLAVAQEANDALAAKNYAKATELLEKVIAEGAESEEDAVLEQVNSAKKNLPIAYFYVGRTAAAAAQKAATAEAKDAKYAEAIKVLNTAIEKATMYKNTTVKNNAGRMLGMVYQSQGGTYFNEGNYEKAAEIFAKGYEADKKNTAMALNLAESYFKMDKYAEGVKVCSEVAALPAGQKNDAAIAQAKAKINQYTNNKIATLQQANDFDGIIAMAESIADEALKQKGLVQAYFLKKDYDPADVRTSMIAAVSVRMNDPVFESQTKTKLGSRDKEAGVTMRQFVGDFLSTNLDNYLHKHPDTAQVMQKKIAENEKARKAISGIQKKAREVAKKVAVNNRKLRDCKVHLTDSKNPLSEKTMIFITEGLSAMGPITMSRDAMTQAVFCLRGKPLNCYGLTKKVVYENEEFNLLQSALNIEDGMENLRYNKVIIATDADVDGMHIRLLMLTFFLQFFPDLVKKGHVYILQTPLFRVKNKKEIRYCYSEEERLQAIEDLKPSPEITRFKGLGEISPDEFKGFIGKGIRLDQVSLRKEDAVSDLLGFYMGKNTMERQNFIINNLVVEEDVE